MNYTLLITTVSILVNPFSLVMISGVTGEVGQVGIENVMLAQSTTSTEFPEYKNQGLIGAEGGVVYIENDDGEEIAFVTLQPGFLKEQVLVTLEEELYKAPPGRYDYLKFDEDEIVTQVGPRVVINFPSAAINLESEAELIAFVTPYEDIYDTDKQNLYESQFLLGDGHAVFHRNQYDVEITPNGVGGTSVYTPAALYSYPPFSNNLPEMYQLTVQPLSITRPQ